MDDEGIAGNSYAAYMGTPSELFNAPRKVGSENEQCAELNFCQLPYFHLWFYLVLVISILFKKVDNGDFKYWVGVSLFA